MLLTRQRREVRCELQSVIPPPTNLLREHTSQKANMLLHPYSPGTQAPRVDMEATYTLHMHARILQRPTTYSCVSETPKPLPLLLYMSFTLTPAIGNIVAAVHPEEEVCVDTGNPWTTIHGLGLFWWGGGVGEGGGAASATAAVVQPLLASHPATKACVGTLGASTVAPAVAAAAKCLPPQILPPRPVRLCAGERPAAIRCCCCPPRILPPWHNCNCW